MTKPNHYSSILVWLILSFLTLVSWLLSSSGTELAAATPSSADVRTNLMLIILAFVKIRLVIIHFMEIGHSPLWFRALFEAYSIIGCAAVSLIYILDI